MIQIIRRCGRGARGVAWLLLGTACLGAYAQQPTPASVPDSKQHPGFQERYPRYRIQPTDSFDLSFEFSPEFNQTVTVQPDGFVILREIGDIYVRGMTFPEAAHVISDRYSAILKQPNISIVPRDVQKTYFIAAGEVAKPGKYELRDATTVAQAIAMAGGFTQDRARHSEVVLFRRTGDALAFGQLIDIKKMYKDRNLSEDLILKPGDLIYVPQNKWSKMKQFVPIPGVGLSMMPAMP